MSSTAIRGGCTWTAAGSGAGNGLRSLVNSNNVSSVRRATTMPAMLRQAPISLLSKAHIWKSTYSTAAPRNSQPCSNSVSGQSAWKAARCTGVRLGRIAGSSSPLPFQAHCGLLGTASRDVSCGLDIGNCTGPRSIRRHFSFRTRRLEGEKTRIGEQSSKPAPVTTSSSGIRKVLPKSIAALTPHENIYTVPNLLTFSRLIATPFIGYALLQDAHTWALGLFVYAGVSDLLDGWIARRWKLQTVVGSIVDPMADKILMTVLTVCLAAKGALPVWLAVIILGRDVGLAISAIYYRWISLPPPKTFTRYWDFSLPSAELALMGSTIVAPFVTAIEVGPALIGLQYIVATTTIWSGLSYVFSKDAVKILSDAKTKEQPADSEDPKKQ
ncbi:CDP-alcohol phosphatidyltransferase-domain-containing protein [Truncatella angustata]|uniref:CDP-alcohol phosphatidyltransferase-domain-containing protein n=1 Tax=Truncatella angustata TaxID=152316 RepID=A0A9P8V0J2_9PEZI|nr:CDP-alcohol phosphatidyltransferase-domain-containing protein [Truncatella angustata]KAH6661259.1 CDP-alcohol phosphatidyltransferase-domain-containing protein [Truncatella angustata]